MFYKQGKYAQAADVIRAIPDEVFKENPEMAYHATLIYGALKDTKNYQHYFLMACQREGGNIKKCANKLTKSK